MAFINSNYLELKENNFFLQVKSKVSQFTKENPNKKLINLGMTDVTFPLAPSVTKAIHEAIIELTHEDDSVAPVKAKNDDFLKEAIKSYYAKRDISLESNEIFISNGVKSDIANITDLFDDMNIVMITDPVFPFYRDNNIMSGKEVVYVNGNHFNKFLPMPPIDSTEADIIYLSSPNNLTGTVYNHSQLRDWVEFALCSNAVILFDASYEAFITDDTLPRSIYEIEDARMCAIEFCNFSKSSSFMDAQCGYTIIPNELLGLDDDGYDISLNVLWNKRQATKHTNIPYIIQKACAAALTEEGQKEVKATIAYYTHNANIITRTLKQKDIQFYGGVNSPYIWMKCPDGMTSWEYFDYLLENAAIVAMPGSEFGKYGEGYVRLMAYGEKEDIIEGMKRFMSV